MLAAVILAYVGGMLVTGGVAHRAVRTMKAEDWPEGLVVMSMAFWPVVAPFMVLYPVVTWLSGWPDRRAARKALAPAQVVNVLADRSIVYPADVPEQPDMSTVIPRYR